MHVLNAVLALEVLHTEVAGFLIVQMVQWFAYREFWYLPLFRHSSLGLVPHPLHLAVTCFLLDGGIPIVLPIWLNIRRIECFEIFVAFIVLRGFIACIPMSMFICVAILIISALLHIPLPVLLKILPILCPLRIRVALLGCLQGLPVPKVLELCDPHTPRLQSH